MLPVFSMELGLSPMLRRPSDVSSSHPSTPFRSRMVKEYLESIKCGVEPISPMLAVYEEDQQQKIVNLNSDEKKEWATNNKVLEYFFGQVAPKLHERINALTISQIRADHNESAGQLQSRLSEGIPVSSHRPEADDKLRAELEELQKKEFTPDQVYAVLQKFNESPASSAEILTAGWIYKMRTADAQAITAIEDSDSDFPDFATYLMELDTVLLKSLQLSSVHRNLSTDASL